MSNSLVNIAFKSYEAPVIKTTYLGSKKYVPFGQDNLFPQQLTGWANKSTTHSALLRLFQNTLAGEGWLGNDAFLAFMQTQDFNTNSSSLLELIAQDLAVYDGFALQVVFNRTGEKVVRLYHIPFERIRFGLPDEVGQINSYFVSANWLSPRGQYTPKEYPAFDPEIAPQHPVQIYVFAKPNPESDPYPMPRYLAALNYIELDYQLSKHHLNNILNGAVPSMLVKIPSLPSPEERGKFETAFKARFQGSENAGNVMLMFDDSGNQVQVEPLAAANNVDMYITLNEMVVQHLLTAHSVTSPTLAGISGSGTLGGNNDEIEMAFRLYSNSVIESYRNSVIRSFKEILKYSAVPTDGIDIKPFNPLKGADKEEVQEAEQQIEEQNQPIQ